MLRYFFVIVICMSCVIALTACASRTEPAEGYHPVADKEETPSSQVYDVHYPPASKEEAPSSQVYDVYYPAASEGGMFDISFPFYFDGVFISEYEVLADEAEFIAMLNDFGLDWVISPMQAHNSVRARPDIQSYFIVCSEGLVGGLISLYNVPREISSFVEVQTLLRLQLYLYREPTEKELERLQKTGLLTADEWDLFWDLSGMLLEREDDVAIIAEYFRAFMEDYERSIEPRTGYIMTSYFLEELDGTVKYTFQVNWAPTLGLYNFFTIHIGVEK